jgi:hypothetical protein
MQSLKTYLYILLSLSCVCAMCSKDDQTDNNSSNNNNNNNGNPDPNSAYVRYTLSNGAGNPPYVNATSIVSFHLYAPSGDTSSVLFNFANDQLSVVNPSWNLCNANYDAKGKDFFDTYFRWTGSPVKALTAGRTYNLNTFDSYNAMPVSQTTGIATYRHVSSGGTTLESWSTVNNSLGSTGRSFIKIEKVDNNTASGSFQFVFTCQPTGSGGLNLNYVTGTFNKIPITQ